MTSQIIIVRVGIVNLYMYSVGFPLFDNNPWYCETDFIPLYTWPLVHVPLVYSYMYMHVHDCAFSICVPN